MCILAILVGAALLVVSGCGHSVTRVEDTNKQLFIQGIEAVNSRNWAALDTQIVANYVRHCQATPQVQIRSLEDFKAYLKQDAATFPDSRITIDKMVAEGNLVAFYCTYTGTQKGPMGPFPASDRKMILEFAGIHRVENGKLVETWLTWDNLATLTQLGHFPPSGPLTK
jgi:predicted ester cyclase